MTNTTTTHTFATIDSKDDIITKLTTCETDEQAQEWFRSGQSGRLVVLDLGAGEDPRVGDVVTVDEDGVAQIATR